jgi:hypothetical protein
MNPQSIPNLPDLTTARVVKAADVSIPTDERAGFSVGDYREIVVNLILKNSATAATIEAYFWSPEGAKFFPQSPAITYSGGEVQLVWTVNRAKRIFIEVSSITGGTPADDRVFLEIGGVPANHEVG